MPSAAVTGVFSGALPGVAWNIGGDRNSRMTSTASYLLLKLQ